MLAALTALFMVGASGCTRTEQLDSAAHLVLVSTEQREGRLLVTVRGDSGARLNARLAPTLEFDDGSIARLTGSDLSTDSAYFAGPTNVMLEAEQVAKEGQLRAGVCRRDATYCETVTIPFGPDGRARRPR